MRSTKEDFPTKSNMNSSVENLYFFKDDDVNVETVNKMSRMSDRNGSHFNANLPIPSPTMIPPVLTLAITPSSTPLVIPPHTPPLVIPPPPPPPLMIPPPLNMTPPHPFILPPPPPLDVSAAPLRSSTYMRVKKRS